MLNAWGESMASLARMGILMSTMVLANTVSGIHQGLAESGWIHTEVLPSTVSDCLLEIWLVAQNVDAVAVEHFSENVVLVMANTRILVLFFYLALLLFLVHLKNSSLCVAPPPAAILLLCISPSSEFQWCLWALKSWGPLGYNNGGSTAFIFASYCWIYKGCHLLIYLFI